MTPAYKFKPNKWLNNFFFYEMKKAIVLYDKVVDFLGWERKVILCKKCFFPSCCFVEQKKKLIGGGKINSERIKINCE